MAERKKVTQDKWFRNFIEFSKNILFLELDQRGKILAVNDAARARLASYGAVEGRPLAQLMTGLKSAKLNDVALHGSNETEYSAVVELPFLGDEPARFLFKSRKVNGKVLLFGEPCSDEISKLRRELGSLRKQYVMVVRLLGNRTVEVMPVGRKNRGSQPAI